MHLPPSLINWFPPITDDPAPGTSHALNQEVLLVSFHSFTIM
jgi:hypothetical protein